MNFKRYTYKALEAASASIKEQMKQTNREDMKNLFYVWHDLHADIERELDRRTLAGEQGEEARHINDDIRRLISDHRIRHYEVADYLGISEQSFSKLLRKPIREDRRQAILKAIEDIRA